MTINLNKNSSVVRNLLDCAIIIWNEFKLGYGK